VENIAGYVYDHTTCDARGWHQLGGDQKGPFYVSMVHGAQRDEFLSSTRSHAEKNPGCDPRDGRVHSLKEMTRWIGIRELALRFIGLGVILGVFELVRPWTRRDQENHEDMINRLERDNDAEFRLSVHQLPSFSSNSTKVVSRSGTATTRNPIIVESSSERASETLPRSLSTTSLRDRFMSRSARKLTCTDGWPSGRSARSRRG